MASELKFDCLKFDQISKLNCLDKECQFKRATLGPDGTSFNFGNKANWLIYKDQTSKVIFTDWSDVFKLSVKIKKECPQLNSLLSAIKDIDKKIDPKRFNHFAISKSPVQNPQKDNACSELLQLKTKSGILYSFGLTKECLPKSK